MDIKYILISVIVIISTAFLVILSIYLNTLNIKRKKKIKILGIAIFVAIIFVCSSSYKLIKERNEELKSAKKIEETYQLAQRGEASRLGLPQSYIDSLQKDPLLKHYFNKGQRYLKEYKFADAILEYKKCLEHPNATLINKTSVHFLIANCYYFLGKLEEAEDEYNKSLKISKNIKDKTDRLMVNSAIQVDIGNIYMRLGRPKEALGYCEKALNNYGEIEFKQGEAITQGNMGVIYRLLNQPQEALSCYMDALEIYRKIDYKIYYPQDIATNLFNIGSAYLSLSQPKEALGYFQDALEIYEEIGYQEGKAVALSNIGDVYQCLEKPQEALFYYEKALKIYKILDNQSQIKKLLSFINNIEEKISIK